MSNLNVKSLTFSIDKKNILSDIDLTVNKGEIIGVVGPSGSGKTSLLKVISGISEVTSGQVFLNNIKLNNYSKDKLSKCISYFSQETEINWPLTVIKTIALGFIPLKNNGTVLSKEEKNYILNIAKNVQIYKHINSKVTDLSTGERARVMLARALVNDKSLLIADEPIASLDPYNQLLIMNILKKRVLQGGSVIIALHDLSLAGRFCDKIIMLKAGKKVCFGKSKEIITKKNIADVFSVDVEIKYENFFSVNIKDLISVKNMMVLNI